jgi:hypothetical protein
MKATNNTDTLFMDIFVELFAVAKVYFEELFKNADPGTYTIKDIYAFIEKNIETTKVNKYTISYFCRVTDNIVSIEKGNFKCSFDIVKVFEYLERFKKTIWSKRQIRVYKRNRNKRRTKNNLF